MFDAKVNTPEYDRLEVLTTLVEAYEQKHYPIEPPDPIAAILYYLESHGLSQHDLEAVIGNQTKVTEILNRQQPLTLEMIRLLHQQLGLPADVLIQLYPLVDKSA